MAATIHKAQTAEQRHRIYQFRYRVYVEELNLFSSVADHQKQQLQDAIDAEGTLFFAEKKHHLVGTLRASFARGKAAGREFEDTYQLSRFLKPNTTLSCSKGHGILEPEEVLIVTRFMVDPKSRGSVVCWQLVRAIAEFARNQQVEIALIDCQPHLVHFYQKLGFRPYKPVYADPHFGMMVPMALLLSDIDYLETIGSPLTSVLSSRVRPTKARLKQLGAMLPDQPPVNSVPSLSQRSWSLRWQATSAFARQASTLWDTPKHFEALLQESLQLHGVKGEIYGTKGQAGITLFWVISGQLKRDNQGSAPSMIFPGQLFCSRPMGPGIQVCRQAVIHSTHAEILAINISAKKLAKAKITKPRPHSLTA